MNANQTLGETRVEPKTKTNSRGDTGSEKESSMKEKTASTCDKKIALRRWTKEGRSLEGTCSSS